MEKTQKELLEKATTKKEYFKFEKDKRVVVGLHNWFLSYKEVDSKFKDGKETKIEFESTVFTKDKDETVQEQHFSTISVRFIESIKKHIVDKNPLEDVVWLSIKKIGEDTSVNYDVEEAVKTQ
jgi:hypothetical protein